MRGDGKSVGAQLGRVTNAILSHLVLHGGVTESTQRDLATAFGCSVSSVGQAVRRLRDVGALESTLCYDEFGGIKGCRYVVTDLGRRLLSEDEERRRASILGGRQVKVMEDQMALVDRLARELHATKQDTVRLLLGEALSARGL